MVLSGLCNLLYMLFWLFELLHCPSFSARPRAVKSDDVATEEWNMTFSNNSSDQPEQQRKSRPDPKSEPQRVAGSGVLSAGEAEVIEIDMPTSKLSKSMCGSGLSVFNYVAKSIHYCRWSMRTSCHRTRNLSRNDARYEPKDDPDIEDWVPIHEPAAKMDDWILLESMQPTSQPMIKAPSKKSGRQPMIHRQKRNPLWNAAPDASEWVEIRKSNKLRRLEAESRRLELEKLENFNWLNGEVTGIIREMHLALCIVVEFFTQSMDYFQHDFHVAMALGKRV